MDKKPYTMPTLTGPFQLPALAIDTGDVVFHKPTGERWVVACVEGERLSWCGWPEGWADLQDCVLIEKEKPEIRLKLLQEMAKVESDHRGRYARRILAATAPEVPPR